MLSLYQLEQFCSVNLDTKDIDSLVDIGSVKINGTLPLRQRTEEYLAKMKNPYCFRCGAVKVKVSFACGGACLDDILKNYFIGLKNS